MIVFKTKTDNSDSILYVREGKRGVQTLNKSYELMKAEILELFKKITALFLPNETVKSAVETSEGFIVLTSRRMIFVIRKEGKIGLSYALPIDAVHEVSKSNKDDWVVICRRISDKGDLYEFDKNGEPKYNLRNFTVSPPKSIGNFQSAMEDFSQVVEHSRKVTEFRVKKADCAYILGLELNPIYWTTDFVGKLTRNIQLSQPTIMLPSLFRAMAIDQDKLIYCAAYWRGEDTIVNEEGIFPTTLIQGLVYKWSEKKSSLIRYDYDLKKGKVRTDRKGNPKFNSMWWGHIDFIEKEKIHVSLRKTKAFSELWVTSGVNHPWIIADAFLVTTGKYLPGSISSDERIPVRFYN